MAGLNGQWKALQKQLRQLEVQTRKVERQTRIAVRKAIRQAQPRVKQAVDEASRIGRGLQAGVRAGTAAYRSGARRNTK